MVTVKPNKDDSIRILIPSKVKNDFIEACDGRSMSAVILKLIKGYIKSGGD